MNVAQELASFATPNGVSCRIAKLAITHPVEHNDFMEAVGSTAACTVVVRWWNATRAAATGLTFGDGVVSRHRAKGCAACR